MPYDDRFSKHCVLRKIIHSVNENIRLKYGVTVRPAAQQPAGGRNIRLLGSVQPYADYSLLKSLDIGFERVFFRQKHALGIGGIDVRAYLRKRVVSYFA